MTEQEAIEIARRTEEEEDWIWIEPVHTRLNRLFADVPLTEHLDSVGLADESDTVPVPVSQNRVSSRDDASTFAANGGDERASRQLDVPERPTHQIPGGFVVTDAKREGMFVPRQCLLQLLRVPGCKP